MAILLPENNLALMLRIMKGASLLTIYDIAAHHESHEALTTDDSRLTKSLRTMSRTSH